MVCSSFSLIVYILLSMLFRTMPAARLREEFPQFWGNNRPTWIFAACPGSNLIVDLSFEDEGLHEWVDGEGTLDRILGLYDDLLVADYRPLFLSWLQAAFLEHGWEPADCNRELKMRNCLRDLSRSEEELTCSLMQTRSEARRTGAGRAGRDRQQPLPLVRNLRENLDVRRLLTFFLKACHPVSHRGHRRSIHTTI
jgi:hypothetical protein